MQVTQPSSTTLQTGAQTRLMNALTGFKPGQMLQARLVGMDADGLAQLKLSGGQTLKSNLPQALPLGSTLQLRVQSNAQNQLTLKLVGQQPAEPGAEPKTQNKPEPSAPRPQMARQGANAEQGGQSEKPAVRSEMAQLGSALRNLADIGKNLPTNTQMQTAGGQPAAEDVTLKLPIVYQGETRQAELRIGREEEPDESSGRAAWQLRFNMDFRALGPLEARLRLTPERLDISVWAEQPEIAAELRTHIEELRAGLTLRELPPGSLMVHDASKEAGPA